MEIEEKHVRQKVQHALRDMASASSQPVPLLVYSSKEMRNKTLQAIPASPKKKAKTVRGMRRESSNVADDDFSFVDYVQLDEERMLIPLSPEESYQNIINIIPDATDQSLENKLEPRPDLEYLLDGQITIGDDEGD